MGETDQVEFQLLVENTRVCPGSQMGAFLIFQSMHQESADAVQGLLNFFPQKDKPNFVQQQVGAITDSPWHVY